MKPGRPTTRDDVTQLAEWAAFKLAKQGAVLPCRGHHEWTSDDPRDQAKAAARCRPCQAIRACRVYAIAAEETTAVWGGLTPEQLRRERRRRRRQAKAERAAA